MPAKTKSPDLLEVIDHVLSAALREVRRARALAPGAVERVRTANGKRTSQTSTCENILKSEGRAMHATALVAALAQRKVHASRDSLVSALSKRVSPRGPFVRTAPNTFGLAGRDSPMES